MVIHSGLPTFDCSIAILGAGAVGKTALLSSLLQQPFPEKHEPTLDEYFMHTIAVDGVHHNLRIVDTAGTFEFPVMRRFAIENCEGFVIVFSLDMSQSFEEAIRLLDEVISVRRAKTGTKIPLVLVANKLDIGSDQREVIATRSSAELEARTEHTIATYVEVSAKRGYPVETGIFHSLVKAATMATKGRKRSKLKGMTSLRKNVSLKTTKCFKGRKRRKFLRALPCVLTKRKTG